MHRTAVIVGAGQAGLAMSRCLDQRGIDHVVLERGRIAESWQSERWDSLRLLTPNWMTRLPGYAYQGPDGDGFMSMPEVAAMLSNYARSFDAPVQAETAVESAGHIDGGYRLETSSGSITCRFLVVATGACAVADVPAVAGHLPGRVHQLTPQRYRRPDQLPDGGVLVVGASASGVQIAQELQRSGRPVTLAVGRHTRVPRRYRGLDIHEWLDLMGSLDRSFESFADLDLARRAPSLQLAGTTDGSDLDLSVLQREGVSLVGRVEGVDGETIHLGGGLQAATAAADMALQQLLHRIDTWAVRHGLDHEIDAPTRPQPIVIDHAPNVVDLRAAGITSVLWATGYRPDHSWLDLPVVQGDGTIPHDGGVVAQSPGLYLLGLPLLRTRKSTFIDGVGADAEALAAHLAASLGLPARDLDARVPA